MTDCIYCLKPIGSQNDGSNPMNPSLEHIVPWALGGSNGCATNDVHVHCNSTLGRTVDSDCINHPLVAMIRQRFDIKSYSGKVPDVVLEGRSTSMNEPVRMTIPHKGMPEFKHEPVVIRQDTGEGEQFFIAGLETDVRRIWQGKIGKAAKLGSRLVDVSTGKTPDIDQIIAFSEKETFDSYKLQIDANLNAIHTEIVKIAYGFMYLIFGPEILRSEHAEAMRKVAIGCGNGDDVSKLITGIKPEVREMLPLGSAKNSDHLICILPTENPLIIVSLFGEGLLTAAVKLPINLYQLMISRSGTNVMAVIDPSTRRTNWTNFDELILHLYHKASGKI